MRRIHSLSLILALVCLQCSGSGAQYLTMARDGLAAVCVATGSCPTCDASRTLHASDGGVVVVPLVPAARP